ncbi:transposase [candidate division KSB1 bacterium]|nr:transposase [candidate division KSB1 bacterium]
MSDHLENFSISMQRKPDLAYKIPFRVFYCWLEKSPYCREEYLLTAGHYSPESPLHLLAVSRQKKHDLHSFEEHFEKLAKRDVNCHDVNMIVTGVNSYYQPLIKKYFPAALHQFSLHHVYENIENLFRHFLAGFHLRNKPLNRLKLFLENHLLLLRSRQNLNEEERQQIEVLFDAFPQLEIPYCFKEAVNQLIFHTQDEAEAYARRDIILEFYEHSLPILMIPVIQILKTNFELIVNHLRIKQHAIFTGQEFYLSLLN